MIEGCYTTAMEAGIDPLRFWTFTYAEIVAIIIGHKRRMQFDATLIHRLGMLCGTAFNEPKKYPNLKEAFPTLFDDIEDAPKQSWEIMKERVAAHSNDYKKNQGDTT